MRYGAVSLFLLTAVASCGVRADNGGVPINGIVHASFEFAPSSGLSQIDILKHWAPQVYQDTRNDTILFYTYHESADMIVRVNYDGDWYAGNNWDNLPTNGSDYSSLAACAYSSFVETESHYFLGYGYFHAADDAIIPMDRHENDYEDVFICVRKGADETDFGTFEAIVMNYHGDRNLYTASDLTFTGSHARIFISSNGDVIGGTNLLNFSEHGHGIEPYVPGNHKVEQDAIVYNVGDTGEIPWETGGGAFTHHYDYELIDIAELWNRRFIYDNNPFKSFAAFGSEGEDAGAHAPFYHTLFTNPASWFAENASFLLSAGTWSYTYKHNPYHENPYAVSALPEGWNCSKVGPSTMTGEAFAWRDVFTLDGAGESTDPTQDQFEFLSVSGSGDMEVVARVYRFQEDVSADSFAGIMIRSSLKPEAPFAALGLTSSRNISFRYRDSAGQALVAGDGSTQVTPVWVKLIRKGNLVTANYSPDGVNWFQEWAPVEVPMSGSLEIGLVAYSQDSSFLAAATFDQVHISSK